MQAKSLTAGSTQSIRNDELPFYDLAEEDCLQQRLPNRLGAGHCNIFKLDQDLNYIETDYVPDDDLAIWSHIEDQAPKMVVTLALHGHSRYAPRHGEDIVFKEGYTSITTFHLSEGARQYQGKQAVRQIRFSIGSRWLARHFGEQAVDTFFTDKAMQVVRQQPTSAQNTLAAQSLMNCHVAGKAKPLFRQGQTMAILANELSALFCESNSSAPKYSARDKTMAYQARDILFAEYQNPPTVETLSRRVGTNPFKLKQLFHHFFANTPYGLLLDIRMKEAHQLLQSGHCSVGMAAEAVGYHHASNFSAAFNKYFGFTPKRLGKR